MPRVASAFRQADVTRVFKGAAAAGITPDQIEVEITPQRIIVRPIKRAEPADTENPWDEVLK